MIIARLWIDAAKVRWALVQCDQCRDVNRFPAQNAAAFPVKCRKCLHMMDARGTIVAALAEAEAEAASEALHPKPSPAQQALKPAAAD